MLTWTEDLVEPDVLIGCEVDGHRYGMYHGYTGVLTIEGDLPLLRAPGLDPARAIQVIEAVYAARLAHPEMEADLCIAWTMEDPAIWMLLGDVYVDSNKTVDVWEVPDAGNKT